MARVCMVAYTYYERDPRVRREAEALIDAGHSVDFFVLRENGQPARSALNGVQIRRIPMERWRGSSLGYILSYSLFLLMATALVSKNHLREPYDLVHVHNMPDFLVFSGILPRLFGKPVILDVHDPMPEIYSTIFEGWSRPIVRGMLLLQERASHRFASHLITVHEGMRQLLMARGVSPAHISVIHNLPDPTIFRAPPSVRKLDGFALGYAGTVARRHSLETGIRAIDRLWREMPDLTLTILGDGPDVARLEALARELEVTDRVFFKGSVNVDQVPSFLSRTHAVLASYSDDAFGRLVFPTKVVEAIMLGLPVLCTRTPTVLEYFKEDALFYYEPGNVDSLMEQIRRMRSHPELAAQSLRSARRVLASLNWESEKRRLIGLVDYMCRPIAQERFEFEGAGIWKGFEAHTEEGSDGELP